MISLVCIFIWARQVCFHFFEKNWDALMLENVRTFLWPWIRDLQSLVSLWSERSNYLWKLWFISLQWRRSCRVHNISMAIASWPPMTLMMSLVSCEPGSEQLWRVSLKCVHKFGRYKGEQQLNDNIYFYQMHLCTDDCKDNVSLLLLLLINGLLFITGCSGRRIYSVS